MNVLWDEEVGLLWRLYCDKPEVKLLVQKLVKERASYWAGWYGFPNREEYERACNNFGIPKEFLNAHTSVDS